MDLSPEGSVRAPSPSRVRRGDARLRERLIRAPEFGAGVAAILLYLFFAATTAGNGFTTVSGTASWLTTAAELGIIAVPLGLLMIAGDFDLSIGSVVGAGSITVGIISGHLDESLWLAMAVAVTVGVLVGLSNGLLVTRTGLPSFIVTLAMNLIVAGLALTTSRGITGSTQVSVDASGGVANLFAGTWNEFNVAIAWWILALLVAAWILATTRFGNWIFATGGDAEAARRAGVLTARVKISLFVCTALAATFVGVLQAVEYHSGDATTGQGYVFQAPIVVVIGGVLLTGGYGSIVGVALGTIIYGIVSSGLFYTGWNPDYAQVVIGSLMVIAVMTNTYIRKLVITKARSMRAT
jgi:simple sugar transport system permease protein